METKKILHEILALLTEVAREQATREFSGITWLEETSAKIDEIYIRIEALPNDKILNEVAVKEGVCECKYPKRYANDNSRCKRCKKKLKQTCEN